MPGLTGVALNLGSSRFKERPMPEISTGHPIYLTARCVGVRRNHV